MKYISLFLFLFIFAQISSQEEANTTDSKVTDEKVTDEKNSDKIDYLSLALKIFESLEAECYPEIEKSYMERMIFEKDKTYPWITDTMGKGINDIGDEVECLNSLKNTTFYMVNFYNLNLTQILENDQHLMNFLEIHNFSLGFCLMYTCREAFVRYVPILGDFINFIASNKTNEGKDLVSFIENNNIKSGNSSNDKDKERFNVNSDDDLATKPYKRGFLILLIVWVIIKLLAGIIRIITIPKGYDKYVAEKINQLNNEENGNIDIEEKTNLAQKHKFNEPLNEESNTKEYNPLFDFSEKLPIYIRILRIFDIINDIHYISSKRNRYYNDTGLEIINFNKAIIIFLLIFSNTFSALIVLPSEEIINSSFFRSLLNVLYRFSNNALLCWGFLEGAYTTYKLMSFISSEMFLYYTKVDRKKVKIYLKLFVVYIKFLILLIPKCITYFVIFFAFYYKIEDFRYLFNAKATYHHIIINIFKHNISCDSNYTLFENNFLLDIDSHKCYEFTYFYINLFLCTVISLIVIYLFFVFRNKFVEIIFMVGNIFIFFYFTFLVKDTRTPYDFNKPTNSTDNNNTNKTHLFLHYHVKGEKYSTTIFECFLGFYFLGFILGFLMFNHDNLRQKINRLLYEYNAIHYSKNNKKKKKSDTFSLNEPLTENGDTDLSLDSSQMSEDSIKIEKNEVNEKQENPAEYYKKYILPYYPLKFLNSFVNAIDTKLSFTNKIIIIIFGVLIMGILSSAIVFYIYRYNSFYIELTPLLYVFFRLEKHVFIIIYFFVLVIMITLPRTGSLRSFMSSKICISISRIGFLITCVSHAFTYLTFLIFSLKVKLYVPTFIIISFGNFLEFFIICVVLHTLTELPFRIIIKKIMRVGKRKESIII